MADNGMDYPQHEKTFSGFASMMTWGTVACAAVAALVIFLITR